MRNRFFSCLPLLLFAVVLYGCGQKGPLYLPRDSSAQPPASEDTEPPDSQPDGSL